MSLSFHFVAPTAHFLPADKEGIAVILCETELENKYRSLAQGRTILESSLHTNLVEHLNSEIGLGTITNITSAKAWLRQSFLFQRIQKNPRHYSVGKDDNQTWEERVDEMVTSSVGVLRRAQLVEKPSPEGNSDELVVTEYGDIMSRVSAVIQTVSQNVVITIFSSTFASRQYVHRSMPFFLAHSDPRFR